MESQTRDIRGMPNGWPIFTVHSNCLIWSLLKKNDVIRAGGRSSTDGRHSPLLSVLSLNDKRLPRVSKPGPNDGNTRQW